MGSNGELFKKGIIERCMRNFHQGFEPDLHLAELQRNLQLATLGDQYQAAFVELGEYQFDKKKLFICNIL